MEGHITQEEFQSALEAYGQSGEKHHAPDGSDYYVPFEHKALFKLLTILKDRGISHMELFRSCDVSGDGSVNIKELEQVLKNLSAEFYQKDTQAIHNFFDIDKNDQCSEAEFLTQLQKAERLLTAHKERLAAGKSLGAGTFRAGGTNDFNDRDQGVNLFIPQFSESAPNVQADLVKDFLVNEFQAKNLQPMRIFSMANLRREDKVKFGSVLDSLTKILPPIPREVVDVVPDCFQINVNDKISKEEFEMLFDVKQQMAQSLASTSARPPTAKSASLRKEKEQDNYAILKYLAQCIEKEQMTPQQLFRMADTNYNGVLSVDELKEQIKAMIPDSFGVLNYKKLLKAFDLNGSGVIEEEEFVGILDMAYRSNADVTQFTKIQKALGTGQGNKEWERAAEGAYRMQQRSSDATHSVTLDQMVQQHYCTKQFSMNCPCKICRHDAEKYKRKKGFRVIKSVLKEQNSFKDFVKNRLTDKGKLKEAEAEDPVASREGYVFQQKDFNWLMDHLKPPVESIQGCEINIPETVLFEGGKPKAFLRTERDGCISHILKNKTQKKPERNKKKGEKKWGQKPEKTSI